MSEIKRIDNNIPRLPEMPQFPAMLETTTTIDLPETTESTSMSEMAAEESTLESGTSQEGIQQENNEQPFPRQRTITKIEGLPQLEMNIGHIGKQRVAAYCRVSTDHEDQLHSLAAQTEYYQTLINSRADWEFVKIFADEGISGGSTKARKGYLEMLEYCEQGRIDLLLCKSVSRFGRNTVDSISAIRRLKELGIPIWFEKESVNTMDSKGEFMLTLLIGFSQEEGRSISQNVTWGRRKMLAEGKGSVAYSSFLGYDRGEEKYSLVINEEQAVIVRKIYRMFIQGYSAHRIGKLLEEEGIKSPMGSDRWAVRTIQSILSNEKYRGSLLLQKYFTVDYLQKKMKRNEGELEQFYIEEDHDAIIDPWVFDYVQEIYKRDRAGKENNRYSGVGLFSSKIICGKCGMMYGTKPWHAERYNDTVWQCRSVAVRGKHCRNHHIYDDYLHYVIHDVSRKLAEKRKVYELIIRAAEELNSSGGTGGSKDTVDKPTDIPKLKRFFTKLKKMDIWEMWSDEDDISFIIRQIIVGEDGVLRVELVDGDTIDYELQEFHPRTMQVGNAEEKASGKKASKKESVKSLPPGATVKP